MMSCLSTITITCWMSSFVVEVDGCPTPSFCVKHFNHFWSSRSTKKGFYEKQHCPRIVMNICDAFHELSHPKILQIVSQLIAPLWCKLIAEPISLRCRSSQVTDAIVIKLSTQDHRRTNSAHTWADATQINFSSCYVKRGNKFWLTIPISYNLICMLWCFSLPSSSLFWRLNRIR